MKYTVEITEMLQRRVDIEADSKETALAKVETLYKCGDIILNDNNFMCYDLGIIEEE